MIFCQVKLAYENVKEVDCLDTTKDGNEQWEDAMKRYEQRIDQVMFFIDQVVFVIKCFMLACVEVFSKISRNSTEITLLTSIIINWPGSCTFGQLLLCLSCFS